ncbi:unnamed protein product [Ectocarpus sp. 8 AP-2014]
MSVPRKVLLSVLAITHVLSLVPPLSTPPSSRTTGLLRGRTATSNHSRRGSGSSRVVRRRHRPRQYTVVGEGGAVAAGDSLSMAVGERKAALGRSSISSRQRRRSARRCHDATAAPTTDGGGTGSSSSSSSSSSSTIKGGAASQDSPAPPRDGGGIFSSTPNGAAAADAGPVNGGTFRELFRGRLPDWLLNRLEQLGFATPTLVQRQALEVILGEERHDAVLHAQTGSGKTLAFLLPLLARVDPSRAAVQGLVVVPTRELGLQVAGVAKRLAAGTSSGRESKIQVMSVLEGSSNKRQRAWAWADPPHIVIGNPESLTRLVTTGAVRVNAVSYVVVDEVDACLLSEGTRASLHELLARSLSPTHADETDGEDEEEAARLAEVGAGKVTGAAAPVNRKLRDRQTVFASATVPQHNHFIRQCVQKQWTLTEPVHVQVHAKEAMPPCLSHYYVVCPPEQKLAVLRALVKRELGVSASEAAATAATGAPAAAAVAAGATAVATTAGEGDGPSDGQAGGGGVTNTALQADTRGLVFALATKPLEGIAASLDKALGGRGSGGGGGGESGGREQQQQQQAKGRGEQPPQPPLAEFLREELGLNARADAMSLFREGKTRLLVSTDMAARGLDVPEITHVFNLDLPLDGEGYVHRGGRAGRLGRPGKVISLVTPQQEFVIRRLGNGIGVDIKKINLGSSRRRPKR